MDPLSDVLSLLKPRSYMAGGFDIAGEISIAFPAHTGVKCYAVVSGEVWLAVAGVAEAVRLEAGDCFLLPRGRPFRLASDLAVPPTDFRALLASPGDGRMHVHKGGGERMIVGGHFVFAGEHAAILQGMLPPVVHLREEADRAALRWALERMMLELRERRPGHVLIVQQLAHTLMVQALRLHLAQGAEGGIGWLFALADRRMSAAIGAMHASPARRWTLQALAEQAGMSRTSFALRFKATVGLSPMDYLTRWRMLLAGDRLASTGDPIAAIALAVGYESESAFSTAFKRVMRHPPRRFRRLREEQDRAPDRDPLRVSGSPA